MKKLSNLLLFFFITFSLSAQDLSYRFEELTAPDYIKAIEKSEKTCIIPLGVFEKHGAHLPFGTDLYIAREMALRASEKEYTVIFPWYYFSQINEAKHQPGTIAYSPELIWKILQETLNELSRNGFEKIIIVNGHGGNNAFLKYFAVAQLSEKRNYSLYIFRPNIAKEVFKKAEELTHHDKYNSHAGTNETSEMMDIRNDLVHTDRAQQQSGMNLERIKHLPYVYTGIWWYASYPNHYGGEASKANAKAGKLILDAAVEQLIAMIKEVKKDTTVPELEKQFHNESESPLKTKQGF